MKKQELTRRQFIAAASASSLAAVASTTLPAYADITRKAGKLAILGGQPVRKDKPWPNWPYVDNNIVDAVVKTTRSGIWCRIQSSNGTVPTFEKEYAKLMGTKFCLATGSGTQALHTCVEALGIGAGDEVITSPYTDPGTIASILSARALPVLLLVAALGVEAGQIVPLDAWAIGRGERKYGRVADWLTANVPRNSAIVAVQFSGALFYFTDLTLLRADQMDPPTAGRVQAAARSAGIPLYAVLFPFEVRKLKDLPGPWALAGSVDDVTIWRCDWAKK